MTLEEFLDGCLAKSGGDLYPWQRQMVRAIDESRKLPGAESQVERPPGHNRFPRGVTESDTSSVTP